MNQLKLLHLYNCAHTGLPTSDHHAGAFSHVANDGSAIVNLPDFVDNHWCTGCGLLNIPGITKTSKIRYEKSRQRVLETKCVCGFKTRTELLNKEKKVEKKAEKVVKEKKGKKKRHDLSSMLQKKQETRKASLSLMEFMT